jgi:hypothetical protein
MSPSGFKFWECMGISIASISSFLLFLSVSITHSYFSFLFDLFFRDLSFICLTLFLSRFILTFISFYIPLPLL